MSEEIDCDTHSLCTGVTEDAFEQFQARSMHYQEKELSLPLNGSTCDDKPSSSDSKFNCPEIEVTSTIEDILVDECLPNVYFNCSTESEDLDVTKNVPDSQNLEKCTTSNTEPNTSTFDVLDNFRNTDECNISQNTYKKRGRKKKNDSSKVADNMSVVYQQNTTQKRGRQKRTAVTKSTLDNETENTVEDKEPLKTSIRNKRLPKNKPNNTTSVDPNSEEISPETIPQSNDLNFTTDPNLTTDPKIVNDDVRKENNNTTQNISCDTPVACGIKNLGRTRGKARRRGSRRGKVKRISASDFHKEVESINEANSCKNNEITMDISSDQMNKIKEVSSDEEDNECLSKLKATLGDNVNEIIEADSEKVLNLQDKTTELEVTALTPSKRNIKVPFMNDYEYNIDTVVKETEVKEEDAELSSSLLEDINTRPSRRKVKKTLQYRDESDEDPFANIGTSEEDEPKKGKYSYYSDDEYIPGKKKSRHGYLESSEEEFDEDLQEVKKVKRKKSKVGKSPTKAKKLATEESNKCILTSSSTLGDDICEVEDIENQLQPTIIGNNPKPDEICGTQSWGQSREFENFLAKKIQGSQLKIKKISTASEANNSLTPLEIPVIDPKEMKKFVDVHAQTDQVKTTSFWTQTCAPNAVKMKDNVDLTQKQSENACEFLKSVFQKTSSLGQLMTKKSDAFVEKKIKTSFVKDTFGIDSCVEKTFLLIKLAKNDLQQMEDNLAMDYDKFLETNNLIAYKEPEKKIKPRLENNDSDCEIIETPVEQPKAKPKFNPKTVFLNKELSIKIAKKTSATNEPKENKINIKGKSAVWLNKSIMVKKVKPTQSFLAQDSRNKKPPDSYVTYKMVNDFFKSYFRQRAVNICAPFVGMDWFTSSKNQIICNYFFVKQDNFPSCVQNGDLNDSTTNEFNNVDDSKSNEKNCNDCTLKLQSLSTLCLEVLRKQMQITEHQKNAIFCHSSLVVDDQVNQLAFRIRQNISPFNGVSNENCVPEKVHQKTVLHTTLQTLSSLCVDVLKNQMQTVQINDQKLLLHNITDIKIKNRICGIMNKKLESFNVINDLNTNYSPNCTFKYIEQSVLPTSQTKTLLLLCLDVLKTQMQTIKCEQHAMFKKTNVNIVDTAALNGKINKYIQSVDGFSDTNKKCSTKDVFRNNNRSTSTPQTLLVLCLDVLKKQIEITKGIDILNKKKSYNISFFNGLTKDSNENYRLEKDFKEVKKSEYLKPQNLSSLCLDVLIKQIEITKGIDILNKKKSYNISFFNGLTKNSNENYRLEKDFKEVKKSEDLKPQNLSSLCLDVLIKQMQITMSIEPITLPNLNVSAQDETRNKIDFQNLKQSVLPFKGNSDIKIPLHLSNKLLSVPDTLKHISFIKLRNLLNENMIFNKIAADERSNTAKNKVKPLSTICFQYIGSNFLPFIATHRIDNVVTLSDHAFVNIVDSTNLNVEDDDSQYSNDEFVMNNDEYESDCNGQDENYPMDNNWVSQVQMKTLMSYDPCSSNIPENEQKDENIMTNQTVLSQVKIEPEDILNNIKVETDFFLEDISIIPDSVCTLQEVEHQNVSVNLDRFEEFVSTNKLMLSLNEEDGVFSQSAARVRRQHAPDSDDENEYDMSLLVPHTFEPLQLNNAKETLMESSSENEQNQLLKKKKIEKRGRGKRKKYDMKNNNKTGPSIDKVEEKTKVNTYVSVITKRMKERIRQKARKMESSDSENEIITKTKSDTSTRNCELLGSEANENTRTLQEKNKQEEKNIETSVSKNEKLEERKREESGSSTTRSKKVNDAIQYAEVDSTECILSDKPSKINSTADIESNVENKEEDDINVINYDEPVELLECEPTLPMFEDEQHTPISKKTNYKSNQSKISSVGNKIPYIERHGWHCYPLDANDEKVYGLAQVALQRLPEEFVDTYNKYLEISVRNEEDAEVDRLINLQSLNRIYNMGEKKRSVKDKADAENKSKPALDTNVDDETYDSDHYTELTPSEDEGEGVEDQIPLEQPLQQTDNHLAKNSLMDDEESDTECDAAGTDSKTRKSKKRHLVKFKGFKREEEQQELMLTADKMMKKELNLLNAPVDLKKEVDEDIQVSPPKEDKKREDVKKKHKSSSKGDTRHNQEKSDDSSSEEEKQWVSTKEKLLKRMGKKQEDTSIEDAKRTKITNEFIVRRSDGDRRNRINIKGRSRRSYKKFLEHQKQLRVLSHELFGENSSQPGKKHSQSYARGRRNIRKVIDKKSLAKSTVIANMEEFERKRRLNTRQHKLREVLGVEEDVNVVVINDEVCLEYDFVTQQPVVTIHPFFTKVMKAHQYEGVKFMWDACFESLSTIQSGQPGGGCILAHCMGLGKTLQVLALLHTVMTHPHVGVKRVLVCCPLSTVLNWVDEIHKWIGPVTNKIKVFELSKLKKTYERAYQLEDWYNGGGIFIIGYELFRSLSTLDPLLDNIRPTIVNKIRTALLDPGPDIVVCDEGHLLKNDCSVLAVAMSRVATKRRIILTGTPIQNNLREYYCMVNFVKPNLLGTYSEYSNRFENPIMNGQHRDSREEDIKLMKTRTHILHKVLEGCLQRQEVSVLYPYLPKKHEYTVFISLTKCQWDLYKHYMNNYAGTNSKQSVLKDFHTLQKIWSHPQVLHNFETRARENINKLKVEKIEDEIAAEEMAAAEDVKPSSTEVWWLPYLDGGDMLNTLEASNKFVAVFKILDECVQLGDKVLIFSTSLFTMDSLEYFLKKIKNWSLGTEYYRLDGSVPPEVRQKWCREFNAENNVDTKLFLISTRAGCLGLNMVAANRVIILDTSWNPAHDVQSIFRVYRFGQKKDCFIYRLVALGTMEQKIYERAVTKQAVACRVVDEQQIDRHYNMSDLMELYRYDETGLGVAGGVAVGVQDVALLRVARLRALHAVHEHDSLLRGSHERDLPEDERAAAWMQFQQEQAHTHYQNQLAVNPPMGRPRGHEYAKSSVVISPPSTVQTPIPTIHTSVSACKQEDTPEQPSESNKFIAFKQCIIPLERLPEIPKQIPPQNIGARPSNDDLDESKIKKITNLLIKYDFHTKPPSELANFIKKIRHIVTSKQLDVLSDCNELTRSIANVLLEKDDQVDFETVIDTEIKSRLDTVLPQQKSPSKKRKAALSAQKLISHQDPTVISIIDSSDEEWTPNRSETSKTPVVERSQQDTDEVNRAVASLFNNIDSILLSDDEEQPSSTVIKSEVAKATDSTDTQDDRDVCLHPSLLTNENFIKIVAHTYLSGNPMLDEDAAVLAAKYSTDKVRAEFERTGNPIASGPIYDIAVKVLGKDVMKKIHTGDSATPKKGTTPKEMDLPVRANKPGPKSKKARMESTAEPTKAVLAPKVKMGSLCPETARKNLHNSDHATEERAKVVPVSMFKGAGNILTKAFDHLPDPSGECILPDDDFCIVDSNPTPPSLVRKNSKPLIINTIVSKGGSGKGSVKEMNYVPIAPKPPRSETRRRAILIAPRSLKKSTEFTGGKLKMGSSTGESAVVTDALAKQPEMVVLGHNPSGRVVPTGHITKSSATLPVVGSTISLDSDDEETIVPTILPKASTSSLQTHPSIASSLTSLPTTVIDSSPLASHPTTQQILLPPLYNVSSLPAQHIVTPMSNIPGTKKFVLVSRSQIESLKSATSSEQASTILRNIMNNPTPTIPPFPPPLDIISQTITRQTVNASSTENPLITVTQNTGGVITSTALPTSPVFHGTQSRPILTPTPTSTAQSQPIPAKEDIKKTKSTSDKSKVNFKCKPGDIFRVTASGKLEVLKSRDDDATDENNSAVAPVAKHTETNDKKKASSSSKVALAKDEETTLKKQTPSSDPLDILKDVVHIRADAYETPHVKAKSNATTDKINTKIAVAASTKTVTNSQTRMTQNKEKTEKSVFTKAKQKLEALKSKVKMNTPSTKAMPWRASSNSESIVNKNGVPVGRIIDTVDLTDLPSTSASNNTNKSVSDLKVSGPKKSPTVVGTSKNIVIGGCGKLVSKNTISKDSPIKETVNLTKSSSNSTRNIVKTEALKRPAPQIRTTREIKKKKADSEMTLKDFDIDDLSDLDDIIELE